MTKYHWRNVTETAPFAPRDGAGALVFNGRMWLLGGWNPDDKVNFPHICNSEVWSSADGIDWRLEVEQAPWEGRHYAGYAVHDGQMWIVGGDPNQGHYQNDVWSTHDGLHWQQVTGQVPWGPRVLHYTVAFGGKLWVMGGQTLPPLAPADDLYFNDIWNSSDGENWEQLAVSLPWSERGMIGGQAIFKNRIWLLGGGTYSTPARPVREFYNEVWSTADGLTWQQHANAPWAPRQYHEVAVFDDCLWVLEGSGGANRNDVWYSPDGESWHEVPDTPWAPRHAASVFVHDGSLWMVAGNNMTSDVWRLVRSG